MKLWRHLRLAVSTAWQSFCRNAAVSVAAVMSITFMLMLGGVNLVIGHSMDQVLAGLQQRFSVISINVADGTPLESVYSFEDELRLNPAVSNVTFVTKDEALQQFESDPANRVIAQQIDGNPVDAKLQVTVNNLAALSTIDAQARAWAGADPTDPTDYQGDVVARMIQLGHWLYLIGALLLAILVVVSIVVVMNTIRTAVYSRRHEIEIMKLVGATEWFVGGPFLLEGVMTGVMAAAIALALVVAGYRPFIERFHESLVFVPMYYDPSFVTVLAQYMLLAGAALGALGSLIGVSRYVRI